MILSNSDFDNLYIKKLFLNRKLIIDNLVIFVTQRCNLGCSHCFNGEAKNIDISEGTIDALFKQIEGIVQIHFSGGEPMLVPDVLEMILEKLIYYKIKVQLWGMITNGTIYNNRIQKLLTRLDKYCYGNNGRNNQKGSFGISNDCFHQQAIRKLGIGSYQCYRNILRNMNSTYYGGQREKLLSIADIGRAKSLNITNKVIPSPRPVILGIDSRFAYLGPMIDVTSRGIVKNGHIDLSDKNVFNSYKNINNSSFVECITDKIDYIYDDMEEFTQAVFRYYNEDGQFIKKENTFSKMKCR